MIERVSASHSTFTLADIARAVAEPAQVAGGGLRRIEETMQRIAADERLVKLNEHRYTTRETLEYRARCPRSRQTVGRGCELSRRCECNRSGDQKPPRSRRNNAPRSII